MVVNGPHDQNCRSCYFLFYDILKEKVFSFKISELIAIFETVYCSINSTVTVNWNSLLFSFQFGIISGITVMQTSESVTKLYKKETDNTGTKFFNILKNINKNIIAINLSTAFI